MSRSRGRLLLTCLLVVTTIDSAAAVCAYVCANRNEPALHGSAQTSPSCHEVVPLAGDDRSLAAAPTRCAPEPPALTPARVDASRFDRAIVLDQFVDVVGFDEPQTSVKLLDSLRSAPPGAPPGAPLPLRI